MHSSHTLAATKAQTLLEKDQSQKATVLLPCKRCSPLSATGPAEEGPFAGSSMVGVATWRGSMWGSVAMLDHGEQQMGHSGATAEANGARQALGLLEGAILK